VRVEAPVVPPIRISEHATRQRTIKRPKTPTTNATLRKPHEAVTYVSVHLLWPVMTFLRLPRTTPAK
jgi:hypothetical protein